MKHSRLLSFALTLLIWSYTLSSLSLGAVYSQGDIGLNWTYPSYDRQNTGFNPQSEITKENVDQLQLQWIYRLPRNPYEGRLVPAEESEDENLLGEEHREEMELKGLEKAEGVEANPLVINGVVYVQTSFGTLTAISSLTGNAIWTFEVNVTKALEKSWIQNRGIQRSITYYKGNIYLQSIDCTIYGLDAVTGKVKVEIPDTCKDIPGNKGKYYGEEAPIFYKDIAILSGASGFGQSRGFAAAYDLNTGKLLWRWFSSPPMEYGATLDVEWEKGNIKPYSNDWVGPNKTTVGAGAAIRTVGVVDEAKGVVYFGIGPPVARTIGVHGHPPMTEIPGPNLYSNSIVALDANTGGLIWYYQIDPHDVHRQGIYASLTLTEVDAGGVRKKVVMAPSFQGFVYVLDSDTGRPIYEPVKIGVHLNDHNANKGSEADMKANQDSLEKDAKGRYVFCPGSEGGIAAPMAYAYNKIYAAIQNECFEIRKAIREGEEYWAYSSARFQQNSSLYAIDASNGKIVWRYDMPRLYWFAGVTVSGGVVYAVDQPGFLYMLDADTGKLLKRLKLGFSGDAGVSIGAAANGKMMLFIVVGTSELFTPTEGMVLAFALPEQASGGGEATVPVTYVVAIVAAVAVAYTIVLVMMLRGKPEAKVEASKS